MQKVSVILSSTPFHGWSTELEPGEFQQAFVLFPEFVDYVKRGRWDSLKLAILAYMQMSVDLPELRVEEIEQGVRFCISQDPEGIERVVIIENTTEIMEAYPFRP